MAGAGWALLALILASPAQAQSFCGDYGEIKAKLKSEYKEIIRSVGVTSNNDNVVLFESPSGSWTLVLRMKTGMACLMASGDNWERLPYIPDAPREEI